MRTVLVQPPLNSDIRKPSFPLGLLSIAAALEEDGHEVEVRDFDLELKDAPQQFAGNFARSAIASLDTDGIDVLGIGSMTCNFHLALEIAVAFKAARPDAVVVFGGPHVTFLAREVLDGYPFIDAVCAGEAEQTAVDLWRGLAGGRLDAVPGAWTRDGAGRAVNGGLRPSLDDLDDLPVPAYHLIDVQRYLAYEAIAWLEVGRGCPFKCNFCSTAVMWEHKYRVKSSARVVREARLLADVYGVRETNFLHDNLTVHKRYLLDLCEALISENVPVKWYCTSRADHLKRAQVDAMRDAGCVDIFFGIESMDAGRQRWLKKNLRPDRVRETLSEVVAAGIRPSLGFIIGFPDETDRERDRTFRYALDMRCDEDLYMLVSYLQIYPGAPLYDELRTALRPNEMAARNNAIVRNYRPHPAIDFTNLDMFPTLGAFQPEADIARIISWRNILSVLVEAEPWELRRHLDSTGCGISDFLRDMTKEGTFLEEDGYEDMRARVLETFEILAAQHHPVPA